MSGHSSFRQDTRWCRKLFHVKQRNALFLAKRFAKTCLGGEDAMTPSKWDPLADCTPEQQQQLNDFRAQLLEFNRHLNLIARGTTAAQVTEQHLLHSLALGRRTFPPDAVIVDWGTGGGLPAIPLAIRFPSVTVYAVDAVAKKIQAVRAMARRLGVTNLHPWLGRAEGFPNPVHYSVSRATAPLKDLWSWHCRVAHSIKAAPTDWPPGLLCLKGGDLSTETRQLQAFDPNCRVETHTLYTWLGQDWFADKQLVIVQTTG